MDKQSTRNDLVVRISIYLAEKELAIKEKSVRLEQVEISHMSKMCLTDPDIHTQVKLLKKIYIEVRKDLSESGFNDVKFSPRVRNSSVEGATTFLRC